MDLSDQELHDLAALLARRVAPPSNPMDQPRLVRWTELIVDAQAGDALPALVALAARSCPHDRVLQETARLLSDEPDPLAGGTFLAGGAMVAVSVALAAGVLLTGLTLGGLSLLEGRGAPAAVIQTASSPLQASLEEVEITHVAVGRPLVETQEVEDGPAPESTTGERPTTAPWVSTKCRGEEGQRVGYWYAGRTSPGEQGDIVTLDHDVYVRADYPRAENHWSPRARSRCVLHRGDLARLTEAPIKLKGGYWWVPVRDGDVVAAGQVVAALD